MVVKDLEQEDAKKKKDKDDDDDSDDDEKVKSKKGATSSQLRKMIKGKGAASLVARNTTQKIGKAKTQVQMARKSTQSGGHVEKFSADAYKSSKGKGDVLKAGKHEPFSYIQLNPRLLNRRKKHLAVQSFSKVVTFGKKQDKRQGLSGLKVNYK